MLGCERSKGNATLSLQPTVLYENRKDESNSKQTFSQVAVLVASQNSWSHVSPGFSSQGICCIISIRNTRLPQKKYYSSPPLSAGIYSKTPSGS